MSKSEIPFICKQCGSECGNAPGIGPVCVNPLCDANDGCGLTKEEATAKRNERVPPAVEIDLALLKLFHSALIVGIVAIIAGLLILWGIVRALI